MQAISFGNTSSDYYKGVRVNKDGFRKPGRQHTQALSEREKTANLKALYNMSVIMANATDRDLLALAKKEAHSDDKYRAGTYAATVAAVPVADTLLRGLTTDAPKLSGKLSAMGKNGLLWGGVFALAGLYNAAVQKVTAVSPAMQKFEDKHPIIKSLLSLAGFAAVLVGGQKGLTKLAEVLSKRMPGMTADLAKAKTFVADFINNSKLNTKMLKPAKDKVVAWAAKNPKTSAFALSALALSVPFMAMGLLFKAFTDKLEKTAQVKDFYSQLLVAREQGRKIVGSIENDMNAQRARQLNDCILASNYENELKPVVVNEEQAENLDIEA